MANLSSLRLLGVDYILTDTQARTTATAASTTANTALTTAQNNKLTSVNWNRSTTAVSPKFNFHDSSSFNGDSLPIVNTTQPGLMSAADKSKLDTLSSAVGSGIRYIGETSTTITDQSTVSTLVPKSTGSLDKTTNFIAGELVIYDKKEFVWTGSLWSEFGSTGSLKKLAFKDNATGTVTIASTTHTHSIPQLSHTVNVTQGSVSVSGSYTPQGTITSSYGGYEIHETDDNRHVIITDQDLTQSTIKGVGGTTSVYSITGVGTLPTLGSAFSVPNVTGVGTLPTSESKSIPNVTSVGTMFSASVEGETLILTPGTAPTLGTAISVNSMKTAGTLPTLGTKFTIPNVTGVGSLPTRSSVSVATAGSDYSVTKVSVPSEANTIPFENVSTHTFSGTAKTITSTGNTSGISVSVSNHAAGTSGTPSATSNASVTVA